jgi:hypothetical protein
MTWLVWRQHRHQAIFGAAALAAFAVLLLITGLHMASQYHSALVSCTASKTCGNLADTLILGDKPVIFLIPLTMAVPALLGLFWGAPLVAREIETATIQFAWMQSITRRRWLTVKTGWILLAATAWGGAVAALVTWWSGPENALDLQAFSPGHFDVQGIVPVGYALFAAALGIAAGTLLRRTLPALAVTLGLFAALRIAILDFVRPHYMTAITTTFSMTRPDFTPAGTYWNLATGTVGPNGQVAQSQLRGNGAGVRLNGVAITHIPSACQGLMFNGSPQRLISCVSAHGYRAFITYQPASRYWAFQGIETGIFVVLAAALIAVTAIAALRRDA